MNRFLKKIFKADDGMQKIRFLVLVLLLALRTGDSQAIGLMGDLQTSNTSVQATSSGTSSSTIKTGKASSRSSSLETGTINSPSVTLSLEKVQSGANTATPSPAKVSTRNAFSVYPLSAIQSSGIVTGKPESGTPLSKTPALETSVSETPVSRVTGLEGQSSSFLSFVTSSSVSTTDSFKETASPATKAEGDNYVTNDSTPSSFRNADSQNVHETPSFTLLNSTRLVASSSSIPASIPPGTSGVTQQLQSLLLLLGMISGNSTSSVAAKFLPSMMNGISPLNTLQNLSLVTQNLQQSPQCAADLVAFKAGLQKMELWALQMIDAMGKLQAGILLGEQTLVGQYDECRKISHKTNDDVIEGLFCTLQVKMNFSSLGGQLAAMAQALGTVFIDVCLPVSCKDDVPLLSRDIADAFGQTVLGTTCITSKDPTGDNLFWVTIGIIAFLTLLGAGGTAYGVNFKRREKREKIEIRATTRHVSSHINMSFNGETHTSGRTTPQEVMVEDKKPSSTVTSDPEPVDSGVVRSRGLCSKLLLSFSVLENGSKLLSFERSQGDLSCLHGIRVITITWVILGHCFAAPSGTTANSVGNRAAVMTMIQDWTMTPLVSGTLSVDTFFLLSGCLTSYLFLRQAQKAGGITCRNMILYYVHRFWRLTPLYMVTIMFYAGIMPYLMSGPYDNSQTAAVTNCRKYWWVNLLYVNNIVAMEKLCLGWSWYLSDDMQFYSIAPLMLVPWALGKRTIGILICVALLIVHIATNPIFITRDNLQYLYGNTQMDYMKEVYFPPWTRVAPFVIGVLSGYALHSTGCKYKMHRLLVLLGWLSATAIGLTAVYAQFGNVKDVDKSMHLAWNSNQFAVYETLSRPAWACAVAWVILACCMEYGGFVNTFLSWRGWAPLSRLTYGVYLFHLITFCVIMGNKIAPFHLSSWTVAELTIYVTVLTYMVSFVFSLLVESPTLGLEKALLGGAGNRKQH